MMLDQNRWDGAGFADALLKNIISERVPKWKRDMPEMAGEADEGVGRGPGGPPHAALEFRTEWT
jgi:hypothetical protein